MTSREQYELLKIIGGLFDRTLEQGTASQFAQQLAADVEVRNLYADLVALNVDLEWTCNTHSQRDLFAAGARLTAPAGTNLSPSTVRTTLTKSPPLAFRFSGKTYSFFSQPVLWCVALVALGLYGSFTLLAWNLRPNTQPQLNDRDAIPVAIVRDAIDVQWPTNATSKPNNSSLLSGELLKIESGTMELELKAGTKLVVEGPADWSVDGDNRVSLRAGKLLARVPEQAIGFTIQTDHATIVDLGTEFSVEVSDAGQTNVQVTRGTVNVEARATSSTSSKQPIRLTAGQAVRVDVRGVTAGSGSFSPAMGPQRADQKSSREGFASLDLVDIIAGGDGRGHARDRGISPHDGRIIYVPDKTYGPFTQLSSTGYQHVNDRPLIDGVSIPNPSKGAVQLTSAGHTFDQFPKTNGETWGPIWAAGSVPDARPPIFRTTFDGKLDYGVAPHGAIALHANKLITFDLEAIRRAHPKQRLVRFRSVVGLTKPADRQDESGLADSWVFIDGQMRHSRLAINSSHEPQTVELPLHLSNRFLTLVATDAGNHTHYDWILFGDPCIDVELNSK